MGWGTVSMVVLPSVGDSFKIDETGYWLKSVVVVVSIEEFDDTIFKASFVIIVFVSIVSEFPQHIKIKSNKKDFFNTLYYFTQQNLT